jgi:hypothetical protein
MATAIDGRAIGIAKRIMQRSHDAKFRGDKRGVSAAARHYDMLIQALNGGTLFASRSGPESIAYRLEMELAAPDGVGPKWSQNGRFLVIVNGMACVVVYESHWATEHFTYNAVNYQRPFISHTGYKSDFFVSAPSQTTVRDHAIERLAKLQETDMCMIDPTAYAVEHDAYSNLPFVVAGLSLPAVPAIAPGTRVRVKRGKELGLVLPSLDALSEGKVEVALLSIDRKSAKHKAAPLSTIRRIAFWPWEVSLQTDADLQDSKEPGKYLTLGMLEALEAITN